MIDWIPLSSRDGFVGGKDLIDNRFAEVRMASIGGGGGGGKGIGIGMLYTNIQIYKYKNIKI